MGAGPSEPMGAGGEPSADVDDGASTWEDVEEEDEDMAAVMDPAIWQTIRRLSKTSEKRR